MDMEQMKAQQSQAQIDTLEHVTISGTIDGECAGVLRLDAIGTEDLGWSPGWWGDERSNHDKSLGDSWRVYSDGSERSICERRSVV